MKPYILYKGATRAPTMFGIPRNVFITLIMASSSVALMVFKPLCMIGVFVYVYFFKVYKKDVDGLRMITLWLKTTWVHKLSCGEDAEYLNEDYSDTELKK